MNKFAGRFWQDNCAVVSLGGSDAGARRSPLVGANGFGADLLYRQRDDDAGAVFEAGFDADVAAMGFDDAADDGQAKPGALGFG